MIKGASMFASSGIGETYFEKAGINIVVANELLPKRGQFYSEMNPKSKMIVGDIREEKIKNLFLNSINDEVKFLIATPPCQGISNLGKNRTIDDKMKDPRNYLIFDVLEVVDKKDFDYIMIENVPGFLKVLLPYKEELKTIEEILKDKYSEKYIIDARILNAKDYGVPQSRPRAIVKMYKKHLNWEWPKPQKEITLREAIGNLPSLESGEKTDIKFHNARKHTENHILWMKHTPTGCSAHDNEEFYPIKKDGSKVKGFNATYKRMKWDAPAPAVTMRSDAISSQENVHPGRLKPDGTYSDARVLTLRELFIVESLPAEWNIPEWCSDTFMRQIIGEAIPPMLSYNIVKGIGEKMIKGASMFSSAGIAETYFKKAGIDIVVANELLHKRGEFYSKMYPTSKMIIGDIKETKQEFIESINDDVKFLIATPPCQGLSTLGMNKQLTQMQADPRNYLVFDIMDVIDKKDFDYIMIENVPRFLTMYFPYKDKLNTLEEILIDKYSNKYIIETKVLNAKDYGVPQSRPRAIVKMYKKGLKWAWPKEQKEITLKEAIGNLPSLESGEKSNIKFHNAKIHNQREIECMRYTPEGCSAMVNEIHYPKKEDGSRVKGFHNTYKRMKWDAPAPARTMNNGNIGSHNNVHPGRLMPDGTYSDARVLTLRELFIVSSLPAEWNIPEGLTDTFIRHIIGEAIPPMLSYNIVSLIGVDEND